MNDRQLPPERVSTQYLLLMTSFFVGASSLLEAFSYALERGFALSVVVKVSVFLLLFSLCCFWINKKNYFYDKVQQKRLVSLHVTFIQKLSAIAVILFWVFLRRAFFGSK